MTPLFTTSTGALTPGESAVPAVAAEQARGPYALRTLVLEPTGVSADGGGVTDGADGAGGSDVADTIRVDLLAAEPEPARILRDRTAELWVPETAGLPDPGSERAEVAVVEALLEDAEADQVGERLLATGAGYVLLRAGEDHPLARVVDRVAGLTRVSSPPGQVLWRVTEGQPGRLRLLDAGGTAVGRVDVTGPHARSDAVLDLPQAVDLVVAEGEGWQRAARVTVDGEPVAVEGSRVPLPAGARELEIEVRRPGLTWHLVALALAVVTAFLALPFGRPRTRRSQHERGGAGPGG
ncbi:hypothetical protein [Ornithinimicrobium flavum]|uniref:hypothetical protein n=1 Tax=Ornithinimicrobium flavum TaxID=1288636 RepID=UPI00106F78E9|nr:hypothetical protein [Ornithinimicrobium flavum]